MVAIPKDPICTFSIPFKNITPEQLLLIVKRELEKAGGRLIGTAQSGRIEITDPVRGTMVYQVRNENILEVFVTEKPPGVFCFLIQAKMEDGVEDAIDEVALKDAAQASMEDDEDNDDFEPPPDSDVTPSPTPAPGPGAQPAPDDSGGPRPAPTRRRGTVMTTAQLQRLLIAAGVKKVPALSDGDFGPVTQNTALSVLRKAGFPRARVTSTNGGRKVRISPPEAASRLIEIEREAVRRQRLIFASVAGILAVTGLVFFSRRARQES